MTNQDCRRKCGKCHKCHKRKHKKSCKDCHVITKRDFLDKETCKLSKTYVIDKPGKYCLGESIDFEPIEIFQIQAAIQILSDDVKLDLCCNKLEQVNGVFDVTGIRIGQDFSETEVFKRITITNGTILKFTGEGIGAFNLAIAVTGESFEDLTFTDLKVLECGSSPSFFFASGIDLDSFGSQILAFPDVPAAYKNVIIKRCNVNKCLGNGAIQVFTGENVIIRDTQANNLVNAEVVFGTFAYALWVRNLQMSNCQGNGTTETDPFSSFSQVGGIIPQDSVNVQIKDCQFNDTSGVAPAIINSNLSTVHNGTFENCQFNNSRGGKDTYQIWGVHLSDAPFIPFSADGLKFINCQFNSAQRTDPNPGPSLIGGFTAVTAKNITFVNCEATRIFTPGNDEFCVGFLTETYLADVTAEVGNARNIVYRNCIASDIENQDGAAIGFYVDIGNNSIIGEHPELKNVVFDNCIASDIRSTSSEKEVAGIYYGVPEKDFNGFHGRQTNLFVKNCRICDVFSNRETPSPLSAGIVTNSTRRPVICNNSVSDCDRGILLTGTDDLVTDTIFQLATTKENALAFPPIIIDLGGGVTITGVTDTNQIVGPFNAIIAEYSPPFTTPAIGPGGLASGADVEPGIFACDPLAPNSLDGQVGFCRRGGCAFTDKTTNVEDAGGITTVIVSTGGAFIFGGPPTGNNVTVMISNSDGNQLIDAIENNIEVTITIDTVPSLATFHSFDNQNTTTVIVPPTAVDSNLNLIDTFPQSLTALGWEIGDEILYTSSDPSDPIVGLENDTTYFAVVSKPGFSENGLIQNNKVDNCSTSGYQDDKTPETSSAWVDNNAFNNGPTPAHDENYNIKWSGVAPVLEGDLSNYPTGSQKAYNISLIP